MCCLRSSPTLEDCVIAGNEVPEEPTWPGGGGGIFCSADSHPALRNCLIAENFGAGIRCGGSYPTLEHCTIAANHPGPGLRAQRHPSDGPFSTLVLKSCIVWGHDAGSIVLDEGSSADVSCSCVAGAAVWPGPGNTSADPLFCAWRGAIDVYVDASRSEEGDGSETAPFQDLGSALAYSYGLLAGSPCLGGGEGGSNMGADRGVCDRAGETSRVVHLAPGSYSIRGFSLVHDVSLLGAGQARTAVEGAAFPLRDGRTLSGITFEGGRLAGILVAAGSGATISSCAVRGSDGGGIRCLPNASPTVSVCEISANGGAGVLCQDGASPKLTGSTISGNSGGGVFCGGQGSSPTIAGSSIEENRGHGIYASDGGNVAVTGSSVRRNAGRGAIVDQASSATFSGCTISENCGCQSIVADCSYAGGGVACYFDSTVSLDDCLVSGNSTEEGAGGVYCQRASVTLRRCRLVGNSSLSQGGAGAVLAYGPRQVLLEACSILGNHAAGGGCAVYAGGNVQLSLVNCEIVGNRAGPLPGVPPSAEGAVIYCGSVSPTLLHCTIAGNSVEQGGVMECVQASPVLKSCLIWGNAPDDSACGTKTGCLAGEDPLFVRAGAFDFERFRTVTVGGRGFQIPAFILEEPDCYLRSGSPAIDAAAADPEAATDIVGTPRPCGAGADIGAYEFCEGVGGTAFRRGDANGDGRWDVSDPVAVLNYLFAAETLSCLDAADADSNDAVELTDAIRLLGFLFLDAAPPARPFRDCGVDPKGGGPGCVEHAPCG